MKFIKDNFPETHRDYIKEWLKESGKKPKVHASGHKMPSANIYKFTPKEEILNMNLKVMRTIGGFGMMPLRLNILKSKYHVL